jgi:hypothetical protein
MRHVLRADTRQRDNIVSAALCGIAELAVALDQRSAVHQGASVQIMALGAAVDNRWLSDPIAFLFSRASLSNVGVQL